MTSGKLATLFLLCCFGLIACGQKGPLYLPGEPPVAETPPSSSTLADEDENDDEDTDS